MIILITYYFISGSTLNNTRTKAENIVKNIELYKEDNWNYPNKLEDLAPKYYKKIPIHYSSIDYNFRYFYNNEEDYFLLDYTYFYPYGRYSYNSKNKTWSNIDD